MHPEEHEWKDLKPVQEALKVVKEPEGGTKDLEVEGTLKDLQLKKVLKEQRTMYYTRTGRNHGQPGNGPISAAGREPSRLRGYWGSD